jgi:hypothetical protein
MHRLEVSLWGVRMRAFGLPAVCAATLLGALVILHLRLSCAAQSRQYPPPGHRHRLRDWVLASAQVTVLALGPSSCQRSLAEAAP